MLAPLSNHLLNSLSQETRTALEGSLLAVALPARTPIFEPGIRPVYAYFLTSGIASVVTDMEGHHPIEVGLLGRESVTSALSLLGPQSNSTRCFMQISGTGLRIEYVELMRWFRSHSDLHGRILQQVQYEAFTLTQLSACNRLHGVEERLARWLLMVADRIGDGELPVTQEFLGQMLGARRSTVTVSAGTLERAGLIESSRGRIRIVNRQNLVGAACACYPNMRKLHRDIFATRPARV